jgi:hypothetical protein
MLPLSHLYKRKQALLRSNLSGIIQMFDEYVDIMDGVLKAHPLLTYSENFMPEKT